MKTKLRYILDTVLPLFIGILLIAAVVYSFFLLHESTTYFDNEAKSIAQRYSLQVTQALNEKIDTSFSEVEKIAAEVRTVQGFEQMDDFGNGKTEQYGFLCLQFLKDGVPEYRYGESVGSSSSSQLQALIRAGKFGNSEIYNDASLGIPCIAVYCPVSGSDETDGVIAYYAVSKLIDVTGNLHAFTDYYFMSSTDGTIIESQISDGMKTDVSHNVFEYIYNLAENKPETDEVVQQVKNKLSCVSFIHIDGKEYVATSIPVESLGGECFVLQLFSADQLLHSEYMLYDKVFGVSVFLAVFAIASLILNILMIRSDKKKLIQSVDFEPVLGCNTYKKFILDAKSILEQNRFAKYAVVYFSIYKYHYLKENLGDRGTEESLVFVSGTCKQVTDSNETFGHVVDDSFVLLMHYSDMTELGERIKLLRSIVSNYGAYKSLSMDVKLSVGVFLVQQSRKYDIQKMIDCAKVAMQANRNLTENPYTVYDTAIATSYLKEAELESKMKAALKNRDFKLFFQPKYSIQNDRIDSAEVLVRWYDPNIGSYIAPDSFIRLFEANGFVCELDHYVFEETCRFLNHLTAEGEKIVPLSVNVSRATAIKPDFLRFYIEKKKEYKVADGFITLEFTESFAAVSYDLFESLLSILKQNGFNCSVDDFGMGNSSLIAVKELPVDELKFDRALIQLGKNPQKDDALLKMLIDVSKELGMTVTQEGVETREDMERMRALGCDIIQGYYYAKPMHIIDFIDFVKGDTSLGGIKRPKISRQTPDLSVSKQA